MTTTPLPEHLRPENWTTRLDTASYDGEETYPFVEDEDANITGLGHQDKAEFAAAVYRFELECGADELPEDERFGPDHIVHAWVTLDEDGERLHPIDSGLGSSTPGAFAVTGLWGQR